MARRQSSVDCRTPSNHPAQIVATWDYPSSWRGRPTVTLTMMTPAGSPGPSIVIDTDEFLALAAQVQADLNLSRKS